MHGVPDFKHRHRPTFKSHNPASMGKMLIPGDVIMQAFMAGDVHGCGMLVSGFWWLDNRCSILDTRCWMLDTGCSILDTGYSILVSGYRSLEKMAQGARHKQFIEFIGLIELTYKPNQPLTIHSVSFPRIYIPHSAFRLPHSNIIRASADTP